MKLSPRDQQQHYKDTKGTPINQEGYDYTNTKYIQLRSLIEFMDGLCYDYSYWNDTFTAQIPQYPTFKGCETLLFSTAVLLHNSKWTRVVVNGAVKYAPSFKHQNKMDSDVYYSKEFLITADQVYGGMCKKIVESVFLTNKNKVLTVYKLQVKFVQPLFEELFLTPILNKVN